jgi:cytochrome c-type biogenesis protein CcmH/NrfG
LKLRPWSVETMLCLGYALRAAGDREGAATAWKSVLELAPGNVEASERLGDPDLNTELVNNQPHPAESAIGPTSGAGY